MAVLTLKTSSDADAVWLWELAKKLGFIVEDLRFGNDNPTVDSVSNLLHHRKEAIACGQTGESFSSARTKSRNSITRTLKKRQKN